MHILIKILKIILKFLITNCDSVYYRNINGGKKINDFNFNKITLSKDDHLNL